MLMIIEEPKVQVIDIKSPVKKIEWCGKVCWDSRSNITESSALPFVKGLVTAGHTSVLEHARISVPICVINGYLNTSSAEIPYGLFSRLIKVDKSYNINVRDYINIGGSVDDLDLYKNACDYVTVEFRTDRAICAELCRHREFSFTQSSTRYIKYKDSVPVCLPVPFDWASDEDSDLYKLWYKGCKDASDLYYKMIQQGAKPQEARNVLPQSTSASLIMTGTFNQWKHLFDLRLAPSAHPQIRYLMEMLLDNAEFSKLMKYERGV